MNSNEVFPILDLIGRVQGKHYGVPTINNMSVSGKPGDTIIGGGSGGRVYLPPNLRVIRLDVERDVDNPVNNEVIKTMHIVYENGARATVELHRGLEEKLPDTVDDHEHYNYVMIVGLTMTTEYLDMTEVLDLRVLKENGYGELLGLEASWNGGIYETYSVFAPDDPTIPDEVFTPDPTLPEEEWGEPDGEEEPDPGIEIDDDTEFGDYDPEYENPNDFYGDNEQKDEVVW